MKGSSIEERREEILSGPIIKTILTLAWPVVISSSLHTLYNLTDTFWLGKVSANALAAPGAAWPVIFLFLAIGMGLSTAGVSLVSQHTGAGGEDKANEAAGQVFGFVLLVGLASLFLGFFGSEFIMKRIVGVPGDVLPLSVAYMKIVSLSFPFIFSYIAFRFLLRGTGDMKTPMYIRGISVVLNLILDPVLIFGLGSLPFLGVVGAAVATAISRSVASIVGIYLLFNGEVNIKLNLRALKPRWVWIKKILDIGAPATIARAGSALGFVFLLAIVSRFGGVAVAAYSVGRRVTHLITIGIWGFAGASMTMVGQNIGAEQKERAETIVKKAIGVSLMIMFVISALMFFFRQPIMRAFTPDPGVISEGARFLAIFSFSIPFFGIYRIFDSTFRGTGHTKPAMALSLFRIWGLRLLLAYLFAFSVFGIGLKLGLGGVWIGMACSNLLVAFFSFLYFLSGRWKEKTIED